MSRHLCISPVVHACVRVVLSEDWKLTPLCEQLLSKEMTQWTTSLMDHFLAPLMHPGLLRATISHYQVQSKGRHPIEGEGAQEGRET